MDRINADRRLPLRLALLFGLLPVVAAILLFTGLGGGGHPPLAGVLVVAAIYPTLSVYLSRALEGTDFPSTLYLILSLLEYPLVGFGVGSLVARAKGWTDRRTLTGVLVLVAYVGAQIAGHVVLNLQSVNVRLLQHANPAVSDAAVARMSAHAGTDVVPALQEKFFEDVARQGYSSNTVVDSLTQLGGAKGWQDLLEAKRLGIAGPDANTWRFILQSVRSMAIPAYAEARGGVKTTYLRDEDITRLTDVLATRLAEHVAATGDSESALTLLDVMKERPDLCAKYLAIVPNGLRGQYSQATYSVLVGLAGIKAGPGAYRTEPVVTKEESIRLVREPNAVADEWTAWVQSQPDVCRPR